MGGTLVIWAAHMLVGRGGDTWNVSCRELVGMTKKLLLVKSYLEFGIQSSTGHRQLATGASAIVSKQCKDTTHASYLIAWILLLLSIFNLLWVPYHATQVNLFTLAAHKVR